MILAVYLLTLAPEVTLRYSGILATSAKYGGVAYPPGFPVWTLYSWLLQTVAAAKATDKAVREHPYQAIGIAFGVGLLIWSCRTIPPS